MGHTVVGHLVERHATAKETAPLQCIGQSQPLSRSTYLTGRIVFATTTTMGQGLVAEDMAGLLHNAELASRRDIDVLDHNGVLLHREHLWACFTSPRLYR